MNDIKFGTDGWRAIIAKDYTTEQLQRVTEATAIWILKKSPENRRVVIGFDCRFGGKMFMETCAAQLAGHGIHCLVSEQFASTPMVSLACTRLAACLGIVITASHNPPSYNGFKLKAHYGGPLSPRYVSEIEGLIPNEVPDARTTYNRAKEQRLVEVVDLEAMYLAAVEDAFDMKLLRNPEWNWAYDAMYGAGQNAMRQLFPDATFLHCEYNPGFDGQAPEPIHRNLTEFSEMIRLAGDIHSGLATDGDADRLGLYNSRGEFVDSHHIILLLVYYLHTYKGLQGKIVNSFSCTGKIAKLAALYGLEQCTTKIGFKYISDIMVDEDVLIGGEESGGIAIKGHIPERDGIWIGLVIWEFMANTGKSLDELIADLYGLVGPFAVERYDLHLEEKQKLDIVENCKRGMYKAFGDFQVNSVEDLDGHKFHLGDERWLMIRASGTEPVLRIYCEAENSAKAFEILDQAKAILLNA